MQVAYLGPAGSFSESAATALFCRDNCKYILCDSLDDLESILKQKQTDFTVTPFFNSKEGVLKSKIYNKTYLENLLAQFELDNNLKIIGEKFVPLNFYLLAKPGSSLNQITHVNVNPYGKNLCAKFLATYPNWKIIENPSSSAAAKAIFDAPENEIHSALASKDAATQYQLEILQKNIIPEEDLPIMHFLVISTGSSDTPSFCPQDMDKELIYVYAVQNTHCISELKSQKIPLLNLHEINGKLYLEISGPLKEKQQHFLDSLQAKKLGIYKPCEKRKQYQEKMLSPIFKRYLPH